MRLDDFVRHTGDAERTLTVVNRTEHDAVQEMLESLFADQPVRIEEATREDADSNLVVLSDGEEVLGVSTMESVRDTVLLVNSDLYITGTRDVDEVATPTVLAGLDELTFSVRGYPDSNREKLLLVEMSRHIEATARQLDDGVLHTGFQHLSRMEDERGTRRVYERLASSDVDVHLYGVPDYAPEIDVHVHGHDDEEIRRSWVVALEGASTAAALLAVETARNEWNGFWTYDADRVSSVGSHLRETYW
ncbi:DICT sensory domain-containing protein [Salinirarus marinus]|uniref:DICT sensory domain-containing protein n=1 Tax=Salinirarus marinus TaxID=3068310 RepID=UPI003C6CC29F